MSAALPGDRSWTSEGDFVVRATCLVAEDRIGPRTVEQLTGSLRAVEISLSEETLQRLDDIWPGPGGEAPEAYAW
jgi:hypothetical protein